MCIEVTEKNAHIAWSLNRLIIFINQNQIKMDSINKRYGGRMKRTLYDGWYWIDSGNNWLNSANNRWQVIRVTNGIVYFSGHNSTAKFDDEKLNNLTRVKINPPEL